MSESDRSSGEFMLRVRLNREDGSRLRIAARQLGLTLSDAVRHLIRQVDLVVKAKLKKDEK